MPCLPRACLPDTCQNTTPSPSPSPGNEMASQNFTFPVPLKSSRSSVKMVDLVAEVTFSQTFQNVEVSDLEAKYVFPLVENAAVSGFKAFLNGTVVEGRVEGREQARKTYEVAVEGGDSAFLLEQHMPDVFEISDSPEGFDLPDFYEDVVYNTGNNGTGNFSTNNATYSADVAIERKGGQRIASVSSPSHPHLSSSAVIAPDSLAASFTFPPQNLSHNATDFVLAVDMDGAQPPQIVWEVAPDGQSVAAMLTLVPAFTNSEEIKPEIVFVTDISGSMWGGKIVTARTALELFLRSLPTDSYFNIIAFNHDYKRFSSTASRKYTAESLGEAENWVAANILAGGGTEILQPLQFVETMPPVEGYARQVIVLTDGQVTNTDQVVELVGRTAETTRYFTIGVGSGASRDLIARVALVGRGHEENVRDGENCRMAVMAQLERAIHASVNDLSIQWPEAGKIFQRAHPSSSPSAAAAAAEEEEEEEEEERGDRRFLQTGGGGGSALSFWSPAAAAAVSPSTRPSLRGSAPTSTSSPRATPLTTAPETEQTQTETNATSVQPSVPEFFSAPSPPPAVYSNKHLTLYALWTAPPSSLNQTALSDSSLSVSLSGTLAGASIGLSAEMNDTGREPDAVGIIHHMATRAVLRDLRERDLQGLLSEEEKKGAQVLGMRFGLASEWISWVATLERQGGAEEPSAVISRTFPQPGGYGYAAPAGGYGTSVYGFGSPLAYGSVGWSGYGYAGMALSPPQVKHHTYSYGYGYGGPVVTTTTTPTPSSSAAGTGMMALIQLQEFEGFFSFADAHRIRVATEEDLDVQSAELMNTVTDALSRLTRVPITNPSRVPTTFSLPDFVATVGAVAWLEADPIRAVASRFVVQKARSWLRAKMIEVGATEYAASVDSLVGAARGTLGF
uniref:VWFA domain-containing protein n=1 Tax=Chromera velia CCMP2878 TaxID=1169474 RepID=A0A0G4FTI0_9ALVE|eukprot:Cvel_18707.t1-p1 / transcript=Cvel_18707.t1 / gene=Cvel_18707 / organism=Chromera_velia_CCMP2878 / gene_product=von Willebrand factor A domain-containing protein, putative / transcript_product=von Willebrand factor A domain-containing protein, putative / location=Cvel_scaffold1567:34514-38620(+) / protein_length=904 / sequence_SO=supercontig / SO=protein_coding / is_pseudo=false